MLTVEFKKRALEKLKTVSPERMVEIFTAIGSVKIETVEVLSDVLEGELCTSNDYAFAALYEGNWQDAIKGDAA